MNDFCTDSIWNQLAETGKAKVAIDFIDLAEFRDQLHCEAREQGVQLRINTEGMSTSRPSLYVYLRRFH